LCIKANIKLDDKNRFNVPASIRLKFFGRKLYVCQTPDGILAIVPEGYQEGFCETGPFYRQAWGYRRKVAMDDQGRICLSAGLKKKFPQAIGSLLSSRDLVVAVALDHLLIVSSDVYKRIIRAPLSQPLAPAMLPGYRFIHRIWSWLALVTLSGGVIGAVAAFSGLVSVIPVILVFLLGAFLEYQALKISLKEAIDNEETRRDLNYQGEDPLDELTYRDLHREYNGLVPEDIENFIRSTDPKFFPLNYRRAEHREHNLWWELSFFGIEMVRAPAMVEEKVLKIRSLAAHLIAMIFPIGRIWIGSMAFFVLKSRTRAGPLVGLSVEELSQRNCIFEVLSQLQVPQSDILRFARRLRASQIKPEADNKFSIKASSLKWLKPFLTQEDLGRIRFKRTNPNGPWHAFIEQHWTDAPWDIESLLMCYPKDWVGASIKAATHSKSMGFLVVNDWSYKEKFFEMWMRRFLLQNGFNIIRAQSSIPAKINFLGQTFVPYLKKRSVPLERLVKGNILQPIIEQNIVQPWQEGWIKWVSPFNYSILDDLDFSARDKASIIKQHREECSSKYIEEIVGQSNDPVVTVALTGGMYEDCLWRALKDLLGNPALLRGRPVYVIIFLPAIFSHIRGKDPSLYWGKVRELGYVSTGLFIDGKFESPSSEIDPRVMLDVYTTKHSFEKNFINGFGLKDKMLLDAKAKAAVLQTAMLGLPSLGVIKKIIDEGFETSNGRNNWGAIRRATYLELRWAFKNGRALPEKEFIRAHEEVFDVNTRTWRKPQPQDLEHIRLMYREAREVYEGHYWAYLGDVAPGRGMVGFLAEKGAEAHKAALKEAGKVFFELQSRAWKSRDGILAVPAMGEKGGSNFLINDHPLLNIKIIANNPREAAALRQILRELALLVPPEHVMSLKEIRVSRWALLLWVFGVGLFGAANLGKKKIVVYWLHIPGRPIQRLQSWIRHILLHEIGHIYHGHKNRDTLNRDILLDWKRVSDNWEKRNFIKGILALLILPTFAAVRNMEVSWKNIIFEILLAVWLWRRMNLFFPSGPFVSFRAKAGFYEDLAESYAYYIDPIKRKVFRKRAARNNILMRKYQHFSNNIEIRAWQEQRVSIARSLFDIRSSPFAMLPDSLRRYYATDIRFERYQIAVQEVPVQEETWLFKGIFTEEEFLAAHNNDPHIYLLMNLMKAHRLKLADRIALHQLNNLLWHEAQYGRYLSPEDTFVFKFNPHLRDIILANRSIFGVAPAMADNKIGKVAIAADKDPEKRKELNKEKEKRIAALIWLILLLLMLWFIILMMFKNLGRAYKPIVPANVLFIVLNKPALFTLTSNLKEIWQYKLFNTVPMKVVIALPGGFLLYTALGFPLVFGSVIWEWVFWGWVIFYGGLWWQQFIERPLIALITVYVTFIRAVIHVREEQIVLYLVNLLLPMQKGLNGLSGVVNMVFLTVFSFDIDYTVTSYHYSMLV